MKIQNLPEDQYSYVVGKSDVYRMYTDTLKIIKHQSGTNRILQIANIVVSVLVAVILFALMDLYQQKKSVEYVLWIIIPIVLALSIQLAMSYYVRRMWRKTIVYGSNWFIGEQRIGFSSKGIKIATNKYKFEYSWQVFTVYTESEGCIILGGGSEPVVFIPVNAGVSDATIDWVRSNFHAI